MRRGEKRLFLGVLAILLAAMLALLIQWVRGANTPKIYHVSVLLDGSDNEYWKNFRAGMNRAALEQNVDLRMVTRYDGDTTQTDALRDEWEGEADGVIIVPTDSAALSSALREAPSDLVVGVAGPKLDSERVNCYISPDYADVGRRLAEAAARAGGRDDCAVYLSSDPSPAAQCTADALEENLTRLGIAYRRIGVTSSEELQPLENGVMIAVESTMTDALCALAEGPARVVGVGASSRLLHYLEDGTAAALVVQSDYDAGYLAVSRVGQRLARHSAGGAVLKSYTATSETMFEDPMIDILFATY